MRRRPVMTMLSGPAASVAGALMHLRVSDGIYFEVGGTTTNIGVIRNGRPTVTYARVGGHETYVSSLDVRVIGIAGGSLVRARPGAHRGCGPAQRPHRRAALRGLRGRERHRRSAHRVVRAEARRWRRLRRGAGCERRPLRAHHDLRGQCAGLRASPACTRTATRRRRGGRSRRSRAFVGLGIEETARAVLDARQRQAHSGRARASSRNTSSTPTSAC